MTSDTSEDIKEKIIPPEDVIRDSARQKQQEQKHKTKTKISKKPKAITAEGKEIKVVLKTKDDIQTEQRINPTLGDKFLQTFFKKPKTIEVRTWLLDGIETAVVKRNVKLGTEQVEIGKHIYNIDYPSIQNEFGKLVFNVRHNDATGALRYQKPPHQTNAKNAKEMLQRNWLTALWTSWKLPLIIAFIAIGCAVVLGMIAFIMYSDGQKKEAVINDLTQDIGILQGEKIQLQNQITLMLNNTRFNTSDGIPNNGGPALPR